MIAEKKQAAETAAIALMQTANAAAIEEKDWLQKAQQLLHKDYAPLFYKELNSSVKNYLAGKLELPVETINKKNIAEALDKKNIPVGTAVQLQDLLNDIERELYTPFAAADRMEELYQRTDDMILLLNTYKKNQTSVNL